MKRGQFYIIAAIIIVISIAIIYGIYNYSISKPEPKDMENIGDNLREESSKILDYGIYNQTDIYSLLKNFTEKDFAGYFLARTNHSNATFIYGNRSELKSVIYYKKKSGSVNIGPSDIQFVNTDIKEVPINVRDDADETEVIILNKTFNFKLKDNDMFYFVIVKEKEGEVYVEKS